jgi:hypothetical protein
MLLSSAAHIFRSEDVDTRFLQVLAFGFRLVLKQLKVVTSKGETEKMWEYVCLTDPVCVCLTGLVYVCLTGLVEVVTGCELVLLFSHQFALGTLLAGVRLSQIFTISFSNRIPVRVPLIHEF